MRAALPRRGETPGRAKGFAACSSGRNARPLPEQRGRCGLGCHAIESKSAPSNGPSSHRGTDFVFGPLDLCVRRAASCFSKSPRGPRGTVDAPRGGGQARASPAHPCDGAHSGDSASPPSCRTCPAGALTVVRWRTRGKLWSCLGDAGLPGRRRPQRCSLASGNLPGAHGVRAELSSRSQHGADERRTPRRPRGHSWVLPSTGCGPRPEGCRFAACPAKGTVGCRCPEGGDGFAPQCSGGFKELLVVFSVWRPSRHAPRA
mmetsp:Transcript_5436/g.22985  ORF Transcript_5436/g.22985 Transcript_5436/m.22985 type:complete len:260 (+) Transcript_5436:1627-2406(+)